MVVKNILDISEECEDCFERLKGKGTPTCICCEGEPQSDMLEGKGGYCAYLQARFSEIFNDNIDDVKRLWNKEKKSKKK
jgi:hypothetical protein